MKERFTWPAYEYVADGCLCDECKVEIHSGPFANCLRCRYDLCQRCQKLKIKRVHATPSDDFHKHYEVRGNSIATDASGQLYRCYPLSAPECGANDLYVKVALPTASLDAEALRESLKTAAQQYRIVESCRYDDTERTYVVMECIPPSRSGVSSDPQTFGSEAIATQSRVPAATNSGINSSAVPRTCGLEAQSRVSVDTPRFSSNVPDSIIHSSATPQTFAPEVIEARSPVSAGTESGIHSISVRSSDGHPGTRACMNHRALGLTPAMFRWKDDLYRAAATVQADEREPLSLTPLVKLACATGDDEETVMRSLRDIHTPPSSYREAVSLAVAFGNCDIAETILGLFPAKLKAEGTNDADMMALLEVSSSRDRRLTDDRFAPLHWASQTGHEEVVAWLLPHWPVGACVRDADGMMPIHYAAAGGHPSVIKLLLPHLEGGAEDADDTGATALHFAACNGHRSAVELLLRHQGAKVADKAMATPLHYAAANGHAEVVKLLLEKHPEGAKVVDKHGRTPLHIAAAKGHQKIIKILLEKRPEWVKDADEKGSTPLHYAAAKGHADVVTTLLERYLEGVEVVDKDCRTPLHYAADKGHADVVNLLLQSRPEWAKGADKHRHTPLHLAADKGHQAVVELLLKKYPEGAKDTDKHGRTPLHLAAAKGHQKIIKILGGESYVAKCLTFLRSVFGG